MGKVYKAQDQNLGKYVAIKVIHSDLSITSPTSLRRFQKEAKLLGQLRHENIVPILDFSLTRDSTPYQVMEFVEGDSLDDWIARGLTVNESLEVVYQIASAMHKAHLAGVIHRDLKPSNIIVNNKDDKHLSVKVIDFGIALQNTSEKGVETLTAASTILGSPLYMSPEQSKSSNIDERSDIYSLGTIMFKCLTGQLPFQGKSAMETIALKSAEIAPTLTSISNNNISEAIEAIVSKCLAIDPLDRFQTMGELTEEIDKLRLDTEVDYEHFEDTENPVPVNSNLASIDTMPDRDSNAGLPIAAAIGFVFLLVGLSIYWLNISETQPPAKTISKKSLAEKAAVQRIVDQAGNGKGYYSFRHIPVYRKALKLVAQFDDRQRVECFGSTFKAASDLLVLKDTHYSQFTASTSNLGDEHLESLLKMQHLTELKACYTKITIDGIKQISLYDNFDSLKLDGMVNNQGLKYLAKMPNLCRLLVRNCKAITDKGLLYLHSSKQLITLDFTGCKFISKVGIEKLKKALPNCDIKY